MTTYFVTGATGLIGGALVRRIIQSEEYTIGQCQVVVLVRDENLALQLLKDSDCRRTRVVVGDLCQESVYNQITENIDYIIHCAAPTQSAYMVSNPVETADSIVLGTRNILEFAHRKKVKGMVYLSSMEVYGVVADIGRPRREEELGDISLDSVRSCYPMAKRMAEHYCFLYAKEYGVPVKVARLSQTFGTGVKLQDNRVYMQFARAVVEQKDIVLKTDGMSMGNYCATEDVVNAIFMILEKGEMGEVYNVVNEQNTMRIRDMAKLVAQEIAGNRIKVVMQPIAIEKTGYASHTELRMSGERLRQLGWSATKTLANMYWDVIKEIEKSNE
ncbi:MAG: NAD(P)-dependent oxidoreductase [Lachnospiraceae bacterium]|nr:NAD(P)-dependent oxidoreductase [Lachnospiraceae bacterium]MBR4083444.1 NAD(P)-dependent oxidoreductase [Lachnospiraceae bacterium]